ncbi:response regulator [Pedobacter sp. MW01-1-1]|uniref:response regulator n=1 Tax=Pedobacter sp. MW01-1-1 TaxID=3383027 RepID=UPI003FF141FD
MIKLNFKQQVLNGFAITLLFVFISALSSYLSIQSLSKSSAAVDHTNDVIRVAQKIELDLVNTEASLRGYLLNKDSKHLRAYKISSEDLLPAVSQLSALIQNPKHKKISKKIESLIHLKLSNLEERINNPLDIALSNEGEDLKIEFLKLNDELIDSELLLLRERKEYWQKSSDKTIIIVLGSSIIIFGLILFLLRYIRSTFTRQKQIETEILQKNTHLAEISAQNEYNNWHLSQAAIINQSIRGQQKVDELSSNIVTALCNQLGAQMGGIFILNEHNQRMELSATFAYPENGITSFKLGDGLVGQTALERKPKLIENIPNNYLHIQSGLGTISPLTLFILPISFEDKILAVLEFGFINPPEEKNIELIKTLSDSIGIALNRAIGLKKLQQLFEQTKQQSIELTAQKEELYSTNEALLHKTEALQASEEELKVQQEELQHANAELEEKALLLEERNELINKANESISAKAEELELSNKYKSEFLANMSHELRTPLNSILILAQILHENQQLNLTNEQVKYAGVIRNAGSDLLNLINDILDLSKIESGNIDLHLQDINLHTIEENMTALFAEIAKQKDITFEMKLEQSLPATFHTDQVRLEQIIKNLLSNAFKFTSKHGHVSLEMGLANPAECKRNRLKNAAEQPLYFKIKDSGIGISKEKLNIIFEAFQQEDGSTSRKYGGTGLGLSISKELAAILGGEIQVQSELSVGSTFTLFLPQNLVIESPKEGEEEEIHVEKEVIIRSDSHERPKKGSTLLIIEDDETFASVLKDYALDKGFNPMVAYSGDVGLEIAQKELPDAIVLDVMLPVMDGWSVLKALKENPETKHIPIHMMSAGDEKPIQAKKEGAIGFLKKPVEKESLDRAFNLLIQEDPKALKNILIIDNQAKEASILKAQLFEKGINVSVVRTGEAALKALQQQGFDCIVLDLVLPDISGIALLDKLKSDPSLQHLPIIINTAMELDKEQMAHILKDTDAMVMKTEKSNDRLLDEVSLFINKLQNQSDQPVEMYAPVIESRKKSSHSLEKTLSNKTILITDDDMRNVFALSSAFQAYKMNVVVANNGAEALKQLESHSKIDLILMDIMMPEMDGYETMQHIRKNKKTAKLPIIALTAKAMKNDREKCIKAGANDYISKPVDIDKLVSMMRVWLS